MQRHSGSLVEKLMAGAGFYSWSIPLNTLTADKAFADIYEIDEQDLARGVPVELILSRIVEDDRRRLAERIHDVILGGLPFVSPYRILCPSGITKSLLSMGSCARDADGVPSIYSGIVLVERELDIEVRAATLELQISDAIGLAHIDGRELTERYLSSALRSLSSSGL